MLVTVYGLDVEMSSLFYILSGVAFLLTTPVAFILRSRRIMRRRVIIYMALVIMGAGCVVRTGNMTGDENIAWVYVGQCLNGVSLALLTTTSFPEIVDSVERTDEYPSYDQEEVNFYISGLFVMLAAIA